MDYKKQLHAILALAYRDWKSFLNNKIRFLVNMGLPIMLVLVVGQSIDLNLGEVVTFNFQFFVLTGIIGQTLFQNTALGILGLIDDRKTGLSQEIFVAPVSRYAIILAKIVGESFVSMVIVTVILTFGTLIGVRLGFGQLLLFIPACAFIAFLGGAFGVLTVGNMKDSKTANQILTVLMGPQFFLAGVITPIKELSLPLYIASRLSPMTYAVDILRNIAYWDHVDRDKVVLYPPHYDIAILSVMFVAFFIVGAYLFIRFERAR